MSADSQKRTLGARGFYPVAPYHSDFARIAAGYEDARDCDALRHDPVLKRGIRRAAVRQWILLQTDQLGVRK